MRSDRWLRWSLWRVTASLADRCLDLHGCLLRLSQRCLGAPQKPPPLARTRIFGDCNWLE